MEFEKIKLSQNVQKFGVTNVSNRRRWIEVLSVHGENCLLIKLLSTVALCNIDYARDNINNVLIHL